MSAEGRDAAARVDPRWDAARVERSLAALHRKRTRRRVASLATVVLGLVLAAGATHAAWPSPAEAPLAPIDHVVRLADGSRITPDEGARVVVEHVSEGRIAVRVDEGAADVDVVPGLARRFEVRVGDVTVTVLGTAFRVERLDAGRARVTVTRGHVDVAWSGEHADLFAGDEGVFPRSSSAIAHVEAAPPPPPPRTEAPPVSVAPRLPASAVPRASGWRALARAERYDEAYAAMDDGPTQTVDDLLLAADVARLSGHPIEALPWLEAIETQHASDPRVVLAAFTRGRILMELGRSMEAAHQLEHVLALDPNGSFAEDALARATLAYAAAGDDADARRLSERYLRAYPGGRWSRRVSAVGGTSGRE